MAVTTENSTEYGNSVATPPTMNETFSWGGAMRPYFFSFTQGAAAGDAGSLANLVTVPAGRFRVILPQSRIYFSAMGTARTMDLGHAAYTDQDGTAVAADPNDLDDGVDVSSAGSVNPSGTIGTHETKEFNSNSGVTFQAQINDGTIPASATISGYIMIVS